MAQFSKIVLFSITCSFFLGLATGQTPKPAYKCGIVNEDPTPPITSPAPICSAEVMVNIDKNAKGGKPCCQWNGDTRSLRCCASYSSSGGTNNVLDDPVCLPGYSVAACQCKPMPDDLTTGCTNSTYYGQPTIPKGRLGLMPCSASGLGLCCEKITQKNSKKIQCPNPNCFSTAQCVTP